MRILIASAQLIMADMAMQRMPHANVFVRAISLAVGH
jgi:hypothetical protein